MRQPFATTDQAVMVPSGRDDRTTRTAVTKRHTETLPSARPAQPPERNENGVDIRSWPGTRASRATSGRLVAGGFVATRLEPPPLRPGTVRRERLVALVGASDASIVTVVAPAGYGKSTLLAQLARADDRRVVWAALDQRDTDPVVLVHHLVAAFDPGGGATDQLGSVSRGPSRMWTSARFLSRVMTGHAPFALFLDDVDAVSDSDSADVVLAVAELLPVGARLVVASRSEPPIQLARLRSTGNLLELDSSHLALDDQEAIALAGGVGVSIEPEAVASINQRAEGWGAGVALALLASKAADAHGAVTDPISGDDRFIADYLQAEVLHGLSETDRTFLRRTAFLDRLSGPLCDAVLGTSGSAAALEAMEKANLFLVPLDHRREWYRHHRLLGDLLRAQLDRHERDLVPALAHRAAAWFEDHDLVGEAIEAGCLAGDVDLVARLVISHGRAVCGGGWCESLLRWLEWFEYSGGVERHPETALLSCWLLLQSGQASWARRWLSSVTRALCEEFPSEGHAMLESWASVIRAALAERGVERMLGDAEAATNGVPEHSPWHADALCLLGVARFLADDPTGATVALSGAVDATGPATPTTRPIALCFRALLAVERGDLHAAEADARNARSALRLAHGMDSPVAIIVDAVTARVALGLGNRQQAATDLAHACRVRQGPPVAFPWLAAQARIELARVSLGLGDVPGARTLLREVDDLFVRIPALGRIARDAQTVAQQATGLPLTAPGASTLTAAELRVLPYLSTHLSFVEIAQRLVLSQNTIKSHAMSIYRKLEATSRSGAVERAVSIGLLEVGPAIASFVRVE
jgi:LuxR family maltose regulon positive regulatory protein